MPYRNKILVALLCMSIFALTPTIVMAQINVYIDIKPGSFPNNINLKSKGVVKVAILTDEGFDATTVNPSTVLFGSIHGPWASPLSWKVKDVDLDGDLDLVLKFWIQELNLAPGDLEATLRCETFDGTDVIGSDTVNIVPTH